MTKPVMRTDSPVPTLAREERLIRRSVRVVVVLRPEKLRLGLPGTEILADTAVVRGFTLPVIAAVPLVVLAATVKEPSGAKVVKPPVVRVGPWVRTRTSLLAPMTE